MQSATDTDDSICSSLSSSANYPQDDAETTTTTTTTAHQRVPPRGGARFTRSSYPARYHHLRLQTGHPYGPSASPLAPHNRRICRDNHSWFTPQMKSVIGDGKSVLHTRLHLCSLFRQPDMANKEERILRYVAILAFLKDEEAYYGDDEG